MSGDEDPLHQSAQDIHQFAFQPNNIFPVWTSRFITILYVSTIKPKPAVKLIRKESKEVMMKLHALHALQESKEIPRDQETRSNEY